MSDVFDEIDGIDELPAAPAAPAAPLAPLATLPAPAPDGPDTDAEYAAAMAAVQISTEYGSASDPTEPPLENMTDLGNARRMVSRYAGKLLYCDKFSSWYYYCGTHWRRDETRYVGRLAAETVRKILNEAANNHIREQRESLIKWEWKSEKSDKITSMIQLARCEPEFATHPDTFDCDIMRLNCLNGTINLKAGSYNITPPNPGDRITKLAPVAYDPEAECPLWERCMERWMDGDSDLIAYLRRLCGMMLTGDASIEELYIFYGDGGNGKSKFLDTIRGIMGDYAGESAPSLLTASGDRHPTELADLQGKRLVIASETEEAAKLKIQLVKRLTGDAKIKARLMRQDFYSFDRTWKIVLVTNNRPIITENTNAIWRRVRLIPWNVTINEDEKDPHLLEKLRAEWPGILAWMVQGCLDWQARGLAAPTAVSIATENYKSDSDPLADFIAEKTILGETKSVGKTALYAAYAQWAKMAAVTMPLSDREFSDHVRKIKGLGEGIKKLDGRSTRAYTGICIRDLSTEYRDSQERLSAGVY